MVVLEEEVEVAQLEVEVREDITKVLITKLIGSNYPPKDCKYKMPKQEGKRNSRASAKYIE